MIVPTYILEEIPGLDPLTVLDLRDPQSIHSVQGNRIGKPLDMLPDDLSFVRFLPYSQIAVVDYETYLMIKSLQEGDNLPSRLEGIPILMNLGNGDYLDIVGAENPNRDIPAISRRIDQDDHDGRVYWLITDSEEDRLDHTISESLQRREGDITSVVQVGPSDYTHSQMMNLLPNADVYGVQALQSETDKIRENVEGAYVITGDGYDLEKTLNDHSIPYPVNLVTFENNLAQACFKGMHLSRVSETITSAANVLSERGSIIIIGHSSYLELVKDENGVLQIGEHQIYENPGHRYFKGVCNLLEVDITTLPNYHQGESDPRAKINSDRQWK